MTSALAGLSIGATIAGGAAQAQGAAFSGQAQQQSYLYQAGVANINQQIAKQNQDYALNAGEQQAEKYGMAGGQRLGSIKASQGSSGLDVNSGSAVAVRAGESKVIHMDLDQIRSNAAKTAYDYDTQATGFENQAKLYRMAGANAKTAASINVESSILGTASSVAGKWLQGSQVGLFGGGSSSGQSFGSGSSATP